MADEPLYSDLLADDPDMGPLVEQFVDDLQGSRSRLREALAAGDSAAVRTLAHMYRGSSGGYGFAALTEAAGELEAAVRRSGAVDETVRAAAERFLALAGRVRAGRPG